MLGQTRVLFGSSSRRNNEFSIPHKLLKPRIAALVHNAFKRRDGFTRYTHIKVGRGKRFFVNSINGGRKNMRTANQMSTMIVSL